MANKGYTLSPEQLALREARKAKKQLESTQNSSSQSPTNAIKLLHRPWIQLSVPNRNILQRAKVMTWNLLAQTLVRRELFPTSGSCLKSSVRLPMLHQEISSRTADILCLQEVDSLDKLLPALDAAGYAHHYVSGQGKKHGCLIAFKSSMYNLVNNKAIFYDDEPVRDGSASQGSTFRTKNVGSIVALEDRQEANRGLIVATTHLFWHPKYTYERARQCGILLREVVKFRDKMQRAQWPCIIGGDFNFAPDDPAYSLLLGDPILPSQEERLDFSRVIHLTIDPTVPVTNKSPNADDEGGGEEAVDPDRVITNARRAADEDGLLSTAELVTLFASTGTRVKSAYSDGLRACGVATFGDRNGLPPGRQGAYEPEWTSYTHYWKSVLDYIFIIDPPSATSSVVGLLKPLTSSEMDPGLPQAGVSGSDHVSLCTEIVWEDRAPM